MIVVVGMAFEARIAAGLGVPIICGGDGKNLAASLARAMAAEPKLLIADESMAGLSHAEVDEILALLIRLNGQGVTVIMIEHIMRAVMEFSQRLAVLVAGRKIADGDPKDVVRNDEVVRAYLGE